MLTVALIVALVWVILIPLAVVLATELGWRLGEHRRTVRDASRGSIVLFPDGRLSAGANRPRRATGNMLR